MPWTPPVPVEIQSQLKKSGQVTLDAAGNGVLTFDPDNARQRWVVNEVTVTTNQSATTTIVPWVTLALNSVALSTMSQGNQRGASWNGNQESFQGSEDVGPADFFTVIFAPPAGTSGSSLAGVVCSAVVKGSKYTRRG